MICPGGGYEHLAIDKEGCDIARWLNTIGIVGIVLKYRLPGRKSFSPEKDVHVVSDQIYVAMEDAQAAMRITRDLASTWNLKPAAIGMPMK